MAPWILLGVGAGALYLIFRPKPASSKEPSDYSLPSPYPNAPPPSHPTILPVTGLSVLDVQVALNHLGYTVAMDDEWGPETESAVRKFQAANGLAADGVVGQQTMGALRTALEAAGVEHPFGISNEQIRSSLST